MSKSRRTSNYRGHSAPVHAVRQAAGTLRIWQRWLRNISNLYVWTIALLLGAISGVAAVGFHELILWMQFLAYRADDYNILHSERISQWWCVVIPVCAGLTVGALLHWLASNGRPHGIADVIRARDLNRGRVGFRDGMASAMIAAVSLGGGASTGREGPIVHLAVTLSSLVARFLHANEITSRMLLGCAAAAGVSALFNAPIAGAMFALEVILGSYSIRVFAPIVIASAAGTIVSRGFLGDYPTFLVPVFKANPIWQLPVFVILGLASALTAVLMTRAIFAAQKTGDRIQEALRMPIFLRPALAGFFLGGLGWMVPEVIGVGYATITAALAGELLLQATIIIFLSKILATMISLGGRFGGGVFTPSLMLGAVLGVAYALLLAEWLPQISIGIYALSGMAAVSAVMLGAPISTTLIAFELTGDYRTALAVMMTVSVATVVAQRFLRRSFFYEQLERDGIPLAGGLPEYRMRTLTAGDVLRPCEILGATRLKTCMEEAALGYKAASDTRLKEILELLQSRKAELIPVLAPEGELLGAVLLSDVLQIYNQALVRSSSGGP